MTAGDPGEARVRPNHPPRGDHGRRGLGKRGDRAKGRPGHAAVEALRANGVEVVFGLNGDHVLKLHEGLADTPAITPVTVKHENNAALAADGPVPIEFMAGHALPRPSARRLVEQGL